MYYAGIEIGGTKLQLVLGRADGKIIDRRRFNVQPEAGAVGIRDAISEQIPWLAGSKVEAIGVGFGGPVDWASGKICRSHQIEGWSEFDMKGWIERMAHCSVKVENDANVAALGEAVCGAGQGKNSVFYVTLGSGVGGGLVTGQKIFHGMSPGEAEIGHVLLNRQGMTVESRCSGWAVDARIRERCRSRPDSLLSRLTEGMPRGEARHLADALQRGDELAREILDEVTADLAFALSHAVHLIHPEVIVLGGGLSQVGEPLRAGVASKLPQHVMEAFHPAPPVLLAALGEDAVPVGALALAAART